MNKELRDKMIDYMGKRLVQVYLLNSDEIFEYILIRSVKEAYETDSIHLIAAYEDFVMTLKTAGAIRHYETLYVLSEGNLPLGLPSCFWKKATRLPAD